MQRSKIRGADIKPNTRNISGNMNAEKCIAYLRGVGVEIDDRTADSWMDTQGTHRFLQSERKPFFVVRIHRCKCGEMEGFTRTKRGRAVRSRTGLFDEENSSERSKCEQCGTGFCSMSLYFQVLRDGTVVDYRPELERFTPIDLVEWGAK